MKNELYFDLLRTDSSLMINKKLLKKLGPIEAIYLANLIDKDYYFSKIKQKKDPWFYAISTKQAEELNIHIKIIRKTKKKLESLGILEIELKGIPAKYYYKINYKKLIDILYNDSNDLIQNNNENISVAKMDTLQAPKWPHCSVQNGHTPIYSNKTNKDKQRGGDDFLLDVFPKEFNTNSKFIKTWKEWFQFRKELKKPLKPTTIKKQVELLTSHSVEIAIEIINISITNGWQGLFPPKTNQNNPPKTETQEFRKPHRIITSK